MTNLTAHRAYLETLTVANAQDAQDLVAWRAHFTWLLAQLGEAKAELATGETRMLAIRAALRAMFPPAVAAQPEADRRRHPRRTD